MSKTPTTHPGSINIEKPRQEYAPGVLSIQFRTKTSKPKIIKEIIRATGEGPDEILAREA